jgi:hypothetical protein
MFLENDMMRGSMTPQEIIFEEKREYAPPPIIEEPIFLVSADVAPPDQRIVNATPAETPVSATDAIPDDVSIESSQQPPFVNDVPINEPLKRSQRTRKPAIADDYLTYLSEDLSESVLDNDPTSFMETMQSEFSSEWLIAMKDEMKSMSTNEVWDLVEIPRGAKAVGCKWVYKIKRDSKGNIERFKARLVAKGFTQRVGIHYKEIFLPVSTKNSFRIIMALVAHYDLELHQMYVKTTFLNGDLHEDVYMAQPEGFVMEGNDHLGCHLKKSIYG